MVGVGLVWRGLEPGDSVVQGQGVSSSEQGMRFRLGQRAGFAPVT